MKLRYPWSRLRWIRDKCAACLVCVRSCPYNVPKINADGVSEIDAALCRGCGVCTSECPAKVIQLDWYEDNQVMSKVEALLEGSTLMDNFEPIIIAFCCQF